MSAVPPPPPPGAPGPSGPPPPPPSAGTPPWSGAVVGVPRGRGLSIAALVCGIVGVLLFFVLVVSAVALVLGLVAASQIKRGPLPHDGLGRARAGWILGAIGVAGFVALMIGVATGAIETDEDGSDVAVDDLEVGECVDIDVNLDDGTVIDELPSVDCDEPHTGEVFLVADLDLDGDEYPGEGAVTGAVQERCFEAGPGYIDQGSVDIDELAIYYLYPGELQWRLRDREFVCFVTRVDGSTMTGSVGGGD